MKRAITCLVGLCYLVCFVSANHGWESGKQYRYKVSGRAMTGIAEIDSKYNGLQLEYEQIIIPKSDGLINVKTENLKVIEVNEQLEEGWMHSELKQGQQTSIPSKVKQYLTSPMELTFKKGVVQSIKVQGDLPTWAVNIKKAMASVWTLDTVDSNIVIEGSLNRQKAKEDLGSGSFFKTLEETIHGECETYYTVSQAGLAEDPLSCLLLGQCREGDGNLGSESQQSAEKRRAIDFSQLCQNGDQIYEIVKTVNFTACTKKPVLAYNSPSALNFHAGDNAGGSLWQRAMVSRYLTCRSSSRSNKILKVTQHEQFYSGLRELEKVFAGAQKNVTLISISNRNGNAVQIQNPKTINKLTYTFCPKEQEMRKNGQLKEQTISKEASSSKVQQILQKRTNWQTSSESQEQHNRPLHCSAEEKSELNQPTMDTAPLSSMLITPLKLRGMKLRVQELMQQIVRDLTQSTETSSIAQREILSTISTVVRILRVLNAPDIKELAGNHLAIGNVRQEVGRSIFLDALAIAGTNPCVNYLLDLIISGQLNGEQAAQTLSTLPMYIRTPTKALLEKYFSLMDKEVVKRQDQVRTTAMLSFSTLVYNACVNKKIKNTRYPVALYGEFCNEQYAAQKFVPYFTQRLEKRIESQSGQKGNKHWVITLLTALGNLGHPDTIQAVQKILDQETDPLIKVKAIFALKNLIQSRSRLNQQQTMQKTVLPVDRQSRDILTNDVIKNHVLPVLVSVAFDRGEHPEVRNAALSLLFACTCADVTIWQQIAMLTWFEQSRDVRSFIVSSLKSFAMLKNPIRGVQWNQHNKARTVLPLAKEMDASLLRSHSMHTSSVIEPLSTGFTRHFQYFGSQDSTLPNYIYYKNNIHYGTGAATVSPIEISLGGNSIQKLVNALVRAVTKRESEQEMKGHEELTLVRHLLNIETRNQTQEALGSLYLNVREEIERLWTFDEESVQKLAQFFTQGNKQNGNGRMNVNYHNVLHLAEYMHSMPTILGFPLVHSLRVSTLLSIRGSVRFDLGTVTGPGPGYGVQADLSPVFAWKIHRQLAFESPFTLKKYQAGVQRHVVFEAPFTAVAQKATDGQFQLAVSPVRLNEGTSKGTIDLITYHQIPYIATIQDEFSPTIAACPQNGNNFEIIHTNGKSYENNQTLGQNPLGLGLVFHVQEMSEFQQEEESFPGWANYFRQFQTISCFFNAAKLGSNSIRFAHRKIVLDMDQSKTKTLVLQFSAKSQLAAENQNQNQDENENQDHWSDAEGSGSGNVLSIALLGKTVPLEPLDDQRSKSGPIVREALQKNNNHIAVQYLLDIAQSSLGKLYVRMSMGHSMPCMVFEGSIDTPIKARRHNLPIRRETLLKDNLSVKFMAKIQYGINCSPHFMTIRGELKRDEEMTEWARSKSPEAKKCKRDEKKGFSVSQVCMEVAEQQAAALNVWNFKIQHSEMPIEVRNYTSKVENLMKSLLYKHMSENFYPSSSVKNGSLEINARMTPNKQFISVQIQKPDSILAFRNIEMNQWTKAFLPITASQTMWGNIKKRLLKSRSDPMCSLEKNYVSTFDKVTYSFQMEAVQGCEHVLAMDRSGMFPMAVLVRDLSQNRRIVSVLLGGETKVEMVPRGQGMTVLINGRQVQLPHTHTVSNQTEEEPIAEIMTMPNGGVQVVGRRVKVASDGQRVVVHVGNALRNHTCGMCGDFNGERVADMRSPRNVPLSTGTHLVASYAFEPMQGPSSGQCKIDPQIQRQDLGRLTGDVQDSRFD